MAMKIVACFIFAASIWPLTAAYWVWMVLRDADPNDPTMRSTIFLAKSALPLEGFLAVLVIAVGVVAWRLPDEEGAER